MPVSRLLLRIDSDRFEAIDVADIYYAEADGGDTVVRTRRRRPYRPTEHLAQFEERLSDGRPPHGTRRSFEYTRATSYASTGFVR